MGIQNSSAKCHRPSIPVLFVALLGFAAPSFAIEYTFVPLAKLIIGSEQYHWGDQSRTINNANQILVAKDDNAEGLGYQIDWQAGNAIYTPLESIVGGDGNTYEVRGFNNNGHFAGTNANPACWGCSTAFKSEGGAQIPLDTPGRSSQARALNDMGQVVGNSYVALEESTRRAALWANGTFTDLGTLGGATSQANDINNHGEIVGYSDIGAPGEPFHATVWHNGVIQDLGTLGGPLSYATAINENGQIAGYADWADGTTRPVIWDNGTITDLLGSNYPTFHGVANDVNIHGAAVGHFGMGETSKAALFQNGTTADLNWFLSEEERSWWWLRNARSINDKGWIVGDAMNQGFEHYAFVLIPQVPEPSTYLMAGVGIALTFLAVRRRKAPSTQFSIA